MQGHAYAKKENGHDEAGAFERIPGESTTPRIWKEDAHESPNGNSKRYAGRPNVAVSEVGSCCCSCRCHNEAVKLTRPASSSLLCFSLVLALHVFVLVPC
jgi:hypothetical protein